MKKNTKIIIGVVIFLAVGLAIGLSVYFGTKSDSDDSKSDSDDLIDKDDNKSSAQWSAEDFGKCNVRCGGGIKTRTVVCKDKDGNVLGEEMCTDTKPITQQECNTEKCASWVTGDWDACSAVCGGGTQTRTVQCLDEDGNAASNCEGAAPISTRTCNDTPCGQWEVSDWSDCMGNCPYSYFRPKCQKTAENTYWVQVGGDPNNPKWGTGQICAGWTDAAGGRHCSWPTTLEQCEGILRDTVHGPLNNDGVTGGTASDTFTPTCKYDPGLGENPYWIQVGGDPDNSKWLGQTSTCLGTDKDNCHLFASEEACKVGLNTYIHPR